VIVRGAGVDHIELVVSSLDRSLEFYCALLEPLGYTGTEELVGDRGERLVFLIGPGVVRVSLREAITRGVPYDRYGVGLHHLAFRAPTRDVVDERLRWAKEQRLQIRSEPRLYENRPGYYAGRFYDPDGIKLEIVHVPDDPR
jgi:glyoxylase I family protein